eukprot:2320378-Rhodomonas_salina.3
MVQLENTGTTSSGWRSKGLRDKSEPGVSRGESTQSSFPSVVDWRMPIAAKRSMAVRRAAPISSSSATRCICQRARCQRRTSLSMLYACVFIRSKLPLLEKPEARALHSTRRAWSSSGGLTWTCPNPAARSRAGSSTPQVRTDMRLKANAQGGRRDATRGVQ